MNANHEVTDAPTERDEKSRADLLAAIERVARDAEYEIAQLREYAALIEKAEDPRSALTPMVVDRVDDLAGDVIWMHKGSTRASNARWLQRITNQLRTGARGEDLGW